MAQGVIGLYKILLKLESKKTSPAAVYLNTIDTIPIIFPVVFWSQSPMLLQPVMVSKYFTNQR